MASIFTGLAFMHGHIVDKELILALGAPDAPKGGATPCGSALARDIGVPEKHRPQAGSHTGRCEPTGACC